MLEQIPLNDVSKIIIMVHLRRIKWHGRSVELFFWNLRLPPSCDICQKKPPYWTSRKSTAQEMAVRLSVSRRLFFGNKIWSCSTCGDHSKRVTSLVNSLGKGFRISCASLKSMNHWKGLMGTIQIISYAFSSFHAHTMHRPPLHGERDSQYKYPLPEQHAAWPQSSQKHSSGLCQFPLLCRHKKIGPESRSIYHQFCLSMWFSKFL